MTCSARSSRPMTSRAASPRPTSISGPRASWAWPATRCVIVEDSLNGVRAGIAAGAFVVLVPNPSVPPAGDARERADLVLDRLADLDPDGLPE